MRLEISQTYAKIGIDRTPSRLDIQSEKAKLEFRQKHAKINITTELPRVEIDQYECFASAGLKNDLDRAIEIAQRAYSQVLDFIGKTASDGDTLAAIENKGDPIPNIVERDAFPEHEFNIDFIPKARPQITIKGGVKYDPERNSEGAMNGVEGKYTPASINFNFTPGVVSISMKQYNSVKIEYRGNSIDTYI